MASLGRVVRLVNSLGYLRYHGISTARRVATCVTCNTLPKYHSRLGQIPFCLSRHVTTEATGDTRPPRTPRRQQEQSDDPVGVVDRQIQIIDSQVKRWGRIDKDQVEQLVQLIENEGSATDEQSLMLLRCLGALQVKESPQERAQYAQQTWKRLEALGAKFGISQWNAYIKARLENKDFFSTTEVLTTLENQRILPNRVTYQLLIARYCEEGDMEGARKVLEYMKSQDMTVNEMVFSCFIKGHMTKGELDEALEVLKTMQDMGLEPTADTYRVLMVGHAERGDLDAIKQVLSDATREEVSLFARHLFPVLNSLVLNGHEQHIHEILAVIKGGHNRYNQDALNSMYEMCAAGHDDAALHIYQCMDLPQTTEKTESIYRVLPRFMVTKQRPIEKVMGVLKALGIPKEQQAADLGWWAATYTTPDYALEVFNAINQEGEKVRPWYIQQVLTAQARAKNKEGMYRSVQCLVETGDMEQDLTITNILYRNGFFNLAKSGETPETFLAKLQEFKTPESIVESLKALLLLYQGQFEEASAAISDKQLSLPQGAMKSALRDGLVMNEENAEKCVEFIQQHYSDVESQSNIVSTIVNSIRMRSHIVNEFIKVAAEKEMVLQSSMVNQLRQGLRKSGASDETHKLLTRMLGGGADYSQQSSVQLLGLSIEELEDLRNQHKETGTRTLAIEKWLLSKYIKEGDVEKAEEVKAALDDQGFVFGAIQLNQLVFLATHHKQDLAEALKYREQLISQFPSFTLYASQAVGIAKLQMQEGKPEDALANLQEYASKNPDQMETLSEGFKLSNHVLELVEACSSNCEPDSTKQLVQMLFELGYIKKGSFSLLRRVIATYLEKDDLDGAVSALEWCVTEYARAPDFSDIFRILVDKEDAERLQKVVDLVNTVFGEMTVLNHLAVAFIQCGRIKQARKILETPGLRAVNAVLREHAQRMVAQGEEENLKHLVDVTRDLFGNDRDQMLFQLIRLYSQREDVNWKKAMDVYATYEEEAVKPRPRTLRYLANILRQEGQEIPFVVPETKEMLKEFGQGGELQSPLEQNAMAAMEAGDYDKVIQMTQKSKESGECLSSGSLLKLVDVLIKQRDHPKFKRLAHEFCDSGDVDSLLLIKHQRLPKSLENFTHQRIFLAYVNSGRTEEILDYLLEHANSLPKYMTTRGVETIAEKNPELIPKLEEVTEKYMSQAAGVEPAIHLFNYYVLHGLPEKASQLLEKYPNAKQGLKILTIAHLAKLRQQEDVLVQLLDFSQDAPNSKGRLALPYSFLIGLKAEQGDAIAALGYFEQAKNAGIAEEELWDTELMSLEKLLQQQGQDLPWEAGVLQERTSKRKALRKRNRSRESSDSSDSSTSSDSSDDERGAAHTK